MKAVLVDTSAWIDFLRGRTTGYANATALAVERDEARICGVVRAELLQGVKGEKEKAQLSIIFQTIQSMEANETDWDRAGDLSRSARLNGHAVPLTDALISAIAQRNKMSVLSADKHFDVLGVNRISWGLERRSV